MTKEELQLVQSHTIVVLLREIWRSIKSKVYRRSKVQSKLAVIATEIYSAKIHVSFRRVRRGYVQVAKGSPTSTGITLSGGRK